MEIPKKTLRRVLEKTLDLLQEQGWGRKHYWNLKTHCYCLSGAVREASEYNGAIQESLCGLLWATIKEKSPLYRPRHAVNDEARIVTWNDYKAKNKAEVVEVVKDTLQALGRRSV